MTLSPILNAPVLIQVHSGAALGALLLGLVQVVAPKGTISHRGAGWTWVGLMAVMILSAFLNHNILVDGPFSPHICCPGVTCGTRRETCASIHLLSVFTLLIVPYAVLCARYAEINLHRRAMMLLVFVVLGLGAVFTAIPHRAIHDVLFGT